jgi:sugar phosphate isomerase/epimerase
MKSMKGSIMKYKIGILLDSLRMPFPEALNAAAEMSVDSIQIYASSHEMSSIRPDLSSADEIRKQIESRNLKLSALVGDPGGHGFEREDENRVKIPGMKKIIDFAAALGTDIITSHIGVIPDKDSHGYSVLQKGISEICTYAAKNNVFLAVETGPEKSAVLKEFIEDTGESQLKGNIEPANLAMVQGEDAVQAVGNLKDYIVHTHAKDGRRIKPCNPREIYDSFAEGNPENLNYDEFFIETALGTGDVDFPAYLKALAETGYSGNLTIEREAGNSRLEDVRKGVAFLESIIRE